MHSSLPPPPLFPLLVKRHTSSTEPSYHLDVPFSKLASSERISFSLRGERINKKEREKMSEHKAGQQEGTNMSETNLLIFITWVASSFSPFPSFSFKSSIALSYRVARQHKTGRKENDQPMDPPFCPQLPVTRSAVGDQVHTFFERFLIFLATGSTASGTAGSGATATWIGGARRTSSWACNGCCCCCCALPFCCCLPFFLFSLAPLPPFFFVPPCSTPSSLGALPGGARRPCCWPRTAYAGDATGEEFDGRPP